MTTEDQPAPDPPGTSQPSPSHGPPEQTPPEHEPPDQSPTARQTSTGNGNVPEEDEPTSCLPAIVAATLLMGILAFVTCGVTTWILFQNRPAIAIRTLDGYVPVVQQSRLAPEEKAEVIEQLEDVRQRLEAGALTPTEASAVMERLVRLPIPQWGELAVVESYIMAKWEGSQRDAGLKELSRLRRAVQIDLATVVDVNHVLDPVTTEDLASPLGRTLDEPLADAEVLDVVERAGLIGDRADLDDRLFEIASIDDILRQRITDALSPQ